MTFRLKNRRGDFFDWGCGIVVALIVVLFIGVAMFVMGRDNPGGSFPDYIYERPGRVVTVVRYTIKGQPCIYIQGRRSDLKEERIHGIYLNFRLDLDVEPGDPIVMTYFKGSGEPVLINIKGDE